MCENNQDTASLRRLFFAYRNGIIADTLRKGGAPHKTIFGLQLPQIREIARKIGFNNALGRSLWNEKDCRESRLTACWIINPKELTPEETLDMARDVRSREEADMLAFKILRYVNEPDALLSLMEKDSSIDTYTLEALRRNLN